MKTGYTRKEISDRLNIGNETLRYYERIGVIPKPLRTKAGYRIYTEEDLSRLKFILRSKELGFSLHEISDTSRMWSGDTSINKKILNERISSKIGEIDQKITALKEIREMLEYFRQDPNPDGCKFLNYFHNKS